MTSDPATQLESILTDVIRGMRKVGVNKFKIHLRSIYKYSGKNAGDISMYEFIIRTIIKVFNVTETQLFHDRGKFVATDARRSAYVLIKKYMKYNAEAISMLFGKSRSTVAEEIIDFAKIIEDDYYKDYRNLHNEAEKKIIEYTEKSGKKKIPKGTIVLRKTNVPEAD